MSGKLKFYLFLFTVLFLGGLKSTAIAQNTESEEEIVGAELTASPMSVLPGDKLTLKIKLKLRDGAHANSNLPDDPYLIATIFTPEKTEGIVWNSIKYPQPTKVVETYSVNPLSVFEDGAEISIQATIGSEISGEQMKIGGTLRVQACDSEQCYPPKNIPLKIVLQLKTKNTTAIAKETTSKVAETKSEGLATARPEDKTIDFDFVDFNGKPRKLSEFRGKYVLLDFWATWCKPCLADIPKLKELYEKYQSKDFEIIGMDAETIGDEEGETDPEFAKETAIRAKNIVKTRGVTWTQATNDSAVPVGKKLFDVKALPTKILIDKEGNIVARIGEKDDLEKAIITLMEAK